MRDGIPKAAALQFRRCELGKGLHQWGKGLVVNWTEQVPTVPGWYWQKDPDGSKRIIKLPHCGDWPTPWEERKAEALSAADDEMRTKLDRLNWKVLWAGPIPEPND